MDTNLEDLVREGLDNSFHVFWEFVKPYTIQFIISGFLLTLLIIFVKKIVRFFSVLTGYSSSRIKKNEKRAGSLIEFLDFLFSLNKKH